MADNRPDRVSFAGSSSNPSMTIPVETLGPAGIRGELHVVAQLPNEHRSDSERLNDTSLRQFKIYALLSKLPGTVGGIYGDFTENDGASYFMTPPETAFHKIETSDGSFRILKNEIDELSLVEFECASTDINSARQQFFRAVLPFLDYMSYRANAPAFVSTTRIEDPKNTRTTIDYISPFRQSVIGTHASRLFLEMRPVYSMYREAKNTSSDFYRFLCFYKILEGLLGKIRAEAYKRAKAEGIQIRAPKQLVPDSPALIDVLRPYVGKPIKVFFDDVLMPKFRNAVAHFMTDDGVVLHMSDPDHMNEYSNIMLICELCVRTVIADHENILAQMQV